MRCADPTAPEAVVLGASYRALGVVRSLGRRGIRVRVLRTDEHVLAGLSRYATGRADRRHDQQEVLRILLDAEIPEPSRRPVLIPTHDEDAMLLAAQHAQLEPRFRVGVPPWPQVSWAFDKRETYRLAARLGIDHPGTWLPRDEEELATLDLKFPVIVKPAFMPRALAPLAPKAWPAGCRSELEESWRKAARLLPSGSLLVQERVAGGPDAQLAYAALVSEGEVRASIAARRCRQRPMDFGQASTFVETIEDGDLAAPAERLVAATRFTGLIEIEYKRSAQDGRLLLLDANPRPWGWMSVGAQAGVDFAYLLWRLLTGRDVERARARPGVRWVRMTTDFPTALGEVRGGRLPVGKYLRSLQPPLDHAVFAADDPLPGLFEPVGLGVIALRRWRDARRRAGAMHDGRPADG